MEVQKPAWGTSPPQRYPKDRVYSPMARVSERKCDGGQITRGRSVFIVKSMSRFGENRMMVLSVVSSSPSRALSNGSSCSRKMTRAPGHRMFSSSLSSEAP